MAAHTRADTAPPTAVVAVASPPHDAATDGELAHTGYRVVLGDNDILTRERIPATRRLRGCEAFAADVHVDIRDVRSIHRFVETAHYLADTNDLPVLCNARTSTSTAEPDLAVLVGSEGPAKQLSQAMVAHNHPDLNPWLNPPTHLIAADLDQICHAPAALRRRSAPQQKSGLR